MSEQRALTIIVGVKAANAASLRALLVTIGQDVEGNSHLQFRKSGSTHFARFVLLDDDKRLLFTSNYDGSEDAYYAELGNTVGAGLRKILCQCEDAPPEGASFAKEFVPYLRAHSCTSQTFFVAFRGKSVGDVGRSAEARTSIDQMLDRVSQLLQSPSRRTPVQTSGGSLAAAVAGSKPADVGWGRVFEWMVGIRKSAGPPTNARVAQDLVAIEDRVVQNQMTVIVGIKPGLWSRLLLRIVLYVTNRIAQSSSGSLSGISTIHFARWAIIDRGTNLLFESNYDGSWERYIDDFVDRASVGLNAIWGNCVGYPQGGARDIEAFKKSIRDYQIAAQVFYSAYPQSTVINIWNDLRFDDLVANGLTAPSLAIANGAPVFPA